LGFEDVVMVFIHEPNATWCRESTPGTTLECNTCKKVFYGNDSYVDLTAASGAKNYSESMPLATEFFR